MLSRVARREILGRILVTALCLLAWRALARVPMPGLDTHGQLPTEAVSVVALGLDPYAGALALMVVLRTLSSTFNMAIRGGSIASFRAWEMLMTAAAAVLVARARVDLWQTSVPPLLPNQVDGIVWVGWLLVLTTGTLTLYGLGQLINARGIGFGGHSTGPLLIYALDTLLRSAGRFAGAAARHASGIGPAAYPRLALGPVLAIGLVALTVAVERAVRRVPIRVGGERPGELVGAAAHSLSLRLLASGVVVPVVIANAVVYAPSVFAAIASSSPVAAVRNAAGVVVTIWRPDGPLIAVDAAFLAIHAALIVAFVVFVAWFWFGPLGVAAELRKLGAVADVRPGAPTGQYLARLFTRLSFAGGVFVALSVVVVPLLAAWATGIAIREAEFDGFAIVLAVSIGLRVVRGAVPAAR
jgi:preprotein translocase subunit SecY